MTRRQVLLVGEGHLPQRIDALATADGYAVVRVLPSRTGFKSGEAVAFDLIVAGLREVNLSSVAATYLVDDRDDINLQFLVALLTIDRRLPVVLALFNEDIAPHLRAANPNVRVVNPAKLAAPAFIDALDTVCACEVPADHPRHAGRRARVRRRAHIDPLLQRLAMAFVAMVTLATTYFHFAEKLSWIDALYFVVVTVATVGYGDISLRDASTTSKLFGIALIIGSTCFIWMIFSLTIDRIIKQRVQLALGRRVYTHRGHVVVCGLGRLGTFVVQQLRARGERVVVVEHREDAATIETVRAMGAEVYIGDARLPGVLHDVGVPQAKAVYAIVNNDLTNLEIGLNARTVEPSARLVLRIFDDGMATRIRDLLDVECSLSMSAVAHEPVYRALSSVPAAAP